jgi:hypothetical protein
MAPPVPTNSQYTSKNVVDPSQIELSHQASNSKLHGTNLAHSIRRMENCEQRRNDLNAILICFGYVLRRTKALKKVIVRNWFSVGWISGLLVLS